MKKKISLLLVALLMAALFVPMMSGSAEGSDVPWDTTKKDTIILSVINNFYTAGERALAEAYMKMHPETEVIVDVIADNATYMAKAVAASKGDYAPDIVHANIYAVAGLGMTYKDVIEKGILYDCTTLLDEVNPYNENKLVRESFIDGEVDYMLALENNYLGYLPLDRIGIGLYYNKDIMDAEGIAIPTSIEELIDACEKLTAAGYDQPLGAASESGSLVNIIADAYYRMHQAEFLTVEGDALYKPETMAVDNNFVWNEDDYSCDVFTSLNKERCIAYLRDHGVATDVNRKIFELFFAVGKYFPKNYLSEDSTTALTNFETQITPLLYMPSYSVGNVNADIQELPESMQFTWGTTQLKTIGESLCPEGFSNNLRALWVYGNLMGIALNDKSTDDHVERVKDFLKFWYSPEGASLCFAETLNAGNYIQGPCIIKGVELGEKLDAYIAGFQTTSYKNFANVIGVTSGSENQMKMYNADMACCRGEITIEEFMAIKQEVTDASIPLFMEKNGWDLDPTTPDTPKQ